MTKPIKRDYASVDIFKLVCAILVIAIHAKPFQNNFWLDAGVGLITRIAVPFFFLSSGFFLFQKLNRLNGRDRTTAFLRYELRILKLYAIWFVIHRLVRTIAGNLQPAHLLTYVKQFFFPTDGSILWFLNALLWAVAIVFLLNRLLGRMDTFCISLVFWVIGYFFSTAAPCVSYIPFFNTMKQSVGFMGIQNGLYFAFPYIALGSLISQMPDMDSGSVRKMDVIGAVASFAALAIESLIAVKVLQTELTFLWLSSLPLTYFVFRIVLNTKLDHIGSTRMIRKISTAVYVIHVLILDALQLVIKQYGIHDNQNLLLFATTVVISILCSYGIVRLSEIKGFGFLKNLY